MELKSLITDSWVILPRGASLPLHYLLADLVRDKDLTLPSVLHLVFLPLLPNYRLCESHKNLIGDSMCRIHNTQSEILDQITEFHILTHPRALI